MQGQSKVFHPNFGQALVKLFIGHLLFINAIY